MNSGHCWESRCSKCGKTNGADAVWQEERPSFVPTDCGWCFSSGQDAVWDYSFIEPVGFTGFVVEPDFPEYFSQSLGVTVSSRKHLKHLQNKYGFEDAVVKGDASKTLVPRDLDRRVKYYDNLRQDFNKWDSE